jgi:hypothetical protein
LPGVLIDRDLDEREDGGVDEFDHQPYEPPFGHARCPLRRAKGGSPSEPLIHQKGQVDSVLPADEVAACTPAGSISLDREMVKIYPQITQITPIVLGSFTRTQDLNHSCPLKHLCNLCNLRITDVDLSVLVRRSVEKQVFNLKLSRKGDHCDEIHAADLSRRTGVGWAY